jgi:putative ATP-binding cassette transporter
LIANVSLAVDEGDGLLIAGASGVGKSSLLRAIAGLWNSGSGTIMRPKLDRMLFLPQRPYMILGTLRSQLLYPIIDREISNEELSQVLKQVNLPDIVERCGGFDAELDFAKVLSVGEQQRLAVARVLLTKPSYAVLDEATSALDEENEERLYLQLRATSSSLVSVSHRSTLLKHHKQVLEVAGDGTWHRVLPASVREIAVAQGVVCHPKWRMAHATKRQVRDPGGDGEGQARYRGMAVDAHEALSAA